MGSDDGQTSDGPTRFAQGGLRAPLGAPEIAGYEILHEVGRGGQGAVYQAFQKSTKRKVAIKVLLDGSSAGSPALQRFEREIEYSAQLRHPNLVTVFDSGTTGDGRRYYVMDYVRGVPITAYVRERKLGVEATLALFATACEAVEHAHRKGIIHRDLKPSNILVDEGGDVRVLDFGLAKTLAGSSGSPAVSMTGQVLGTLYYLSPEQTRGNPDAVDARSDVFALGVVLYELLAGRTPYEGGEMIDVMRQISEARPPPLSDRWSPESGIAPDPGITRLPRHCPVTPEVETIVLRALAKEPERRYRTAGDLAQDLRRHLNAEPVEARRDGVSYHMGQTMKRVRRDRTTASLALTVLFLLALLGTGAWLLWPERARAFGSVAVLPLADATEEEGEYLSDVTTESLLRGLSRAPGLKVMSRSATARFRGTTLDLKQVGKELGVQAVLAGKVVKRSPGSAVSLELVDTRDGRLLWSQQYDRGRYDTLAVQAEICRGVAAALHVTIGEAEGKRMDARGTADDEAYQAYLRGKMFFNKLTEPDLRKAIASFEAAAKRDPNFALAQCGLADAYVALAIDWMPPKEAYPLAKKHAEKALALDSSLADAHLSMGTVHYYMEWDWSAAQRELQRALELDAKSAETNTCYLHSLDSMGRPEQAVGEVERALKLNPLSVSLHGELGCASYYSRNYDRSIRHCHEALEMDRAFAMGSWNLARSYSQKGMYGEAVAELNKATAFLGEWPGFASELAYAHALSGNRAEAERIRGELEARATKAYVDPYFIAIATLALGRTDEALGELEKAYEVRSCSMPFLGVEPKFDVLRSNPRFIELARRVGVTLPTTVPASAPSEVR